MAEIISLKSHKTKAYLAVLVAALGYFVDAYDVVLFSVVRKASLEAIGISGDQAVTTGVMLLNTQLVGMLIGGVVWGMIGDKLGRIQVLFGSILLYSLANLGNAFVGDVNTYMVLRFIAGFGLAGEIGAGITLVSELLPKETRGIATAIVAGVGVSGAATAALVAKFFHWQTSYIIGGVMGLCLLAMRISVCESGMFNNVKQDKKVAKGSLTLLFSSKTRIKKYLASIFVGTPVWLVVGVLATFAPEITKSIGMETPMSAADGMLIATSVAAIGDFTSGLLCQYFKSRRKVIAGCLIIASVSISILLSLRNPNPAVVYLLYGIVGLSCGYWATLLTCAAEQFGTNLRATVATSVPNFVRGLAIPITFGFDYFRQFVGAGNATLAISIICCGTAFIALWVMEETFGKDLNYIEQDEENEPFIKVANS